MTSVACWADNCKWMACGWCKRGSISISEDYECEDFEIYSHSYTDSYWIACLNGGEAQRKFVERGKKIEYNGFVFYTKDKITEIGDYWLTEARTGMGICQYNELEKRWDKFLERVDTYPDVMTLPIYESEDENDND